MKNKDAKELLKKLRKMKYISKSGWEQSFLSDISWNVDQLNCDLSQRQTTKLLEISRKATEEFCEQENKKWSTA